MKKIFAFLLLFTVVAASAFAQSYGKLWKTVEEARAKDLPRTALERVDNIYGKAFAEGNDVEILRALLARHTFVGDISADSLPAAKQRIENFLEQEQNPAMKALLHSALGMLYRQSAYSDTLAERKSLQHFEASVQDVAALGAAKAKSYVPVLLLGKDSKIFRGDLLHVLGRAAVQGLPERSEEARSLRNAVFTSLRGYYRDQKVPGADLLTGIDSLGMAPRKWNIPLEQQDAYRTLLAWKEMYREVQENVFTYIALSELSTGGERGDSLLALLLREGLQRYGRSPYAGKLRRALDRIEGSSISLSQMNHYLYPESDILLSISHQAVQRAKVRIFKLPFASSELNEGALTKKLLRKAAKNGQDYELSLSPRPDYASATDSLRIRVGEAGIYRAQLFVDGKEVDAANFCVSAVQPVYQPINASQHRILAVDALTGAQLKDVRLLLRNKRQAHTDTLLCNAKGELIVDSKRCRDCELFVETPTDCFAPAFNIYGNYFGSGAERRTEQTMLRIFTDRGIYRPGQSVHFGGFAYVQRGNDVAVKKEAEFVLTLTDAYGKKVASDTLTTDLLGNLGGTFVLPKTVLNGSYYIEGSGGAVVHLRVEEYKRPTFTAEFEEPAAAYAAGDTVILKGVARTYNGLPVADAEVRFRQSSSSHFVWRGREEQSAVLLADSARTDAEGRFSVGVVLAGEEDFLTNRSYISRGLRVEADVTAENGETVSASRMLHYANRPAVLMADWKETICKEQLPTMNIRLLNPSGKEIRAEGQYCVYDAKGKCVAKEHFFSSRTFVPTVLAQLPSGAYRITTTMNEPLSGVDSISAEVLIFSKSDSRPASAAPLWLYADGNERGDSISVLVGSSLRDATLFCDVFSADSLLESSRMNICDSLLRLNYAYLPHYGDGARIVFSLVCDGVLHSRNAEVKRPLPEKRLRLRWSTFRGILRPGQTEMWHLQVSTSDGQPADAAVMATLYDASLDAFEKNSWDFALHFPCRLPYAFGVAPENNRLSLSKIFELPVRKLRSPKFSHWDAALFAWQYSGLSVPQRVSLRNGKKNAALTLNRMESADLIMSKDAAAPEVAAGSAESHIDVRSNFAETAFFYPALRTNEQGIATIAFTLPESLTAWNFRALAHTAAMEYGRLDTCVVAQKEFMAQLSVPRFLCEGDRIVLPATLRNLSDEEVKGTLSLTLEDAVSGRTLSTQQQRFSLLEKGAMAYDFELRAPENVTAVICRLTADGATFSDGEEHLLLVLSDRVGIVASLPLDLEGNQTETVRIDTLWSKSANAADKTLIVETTANTVWNFINSLPTEREFDSKSATDWAANLYVATMLMDMGKKYPAFAEEARRRAAEAQSSHWQSMLQRNPDLKNVLLEETPWCCDAENEAQRYARLAELLDTTTQSARIYSCLHKLRDLQTAEGGWAWMKGMRANGNTTLEVAKLLARIQAEQPTQEIGGMLRRATAYLENVAGKSIEAMREKDLQAAKNEQLLDYLYFRTLLKQKPEGAAKKDFDYLLDLFAEPSVTETMEEKAIRAFVLLENGKTKAGNLAVKSLLEHTLVAKESGRYFDTPRTKVYGAAFRIPTQVATLEALAVAERKSDYGRETKELLQWLTRSTRTEAFDFCYILPGILSDFAGTCLRETSEPIGHLLLRNNRTLSLSESGVEASAPHISYTYDRYTGKPEVDASAVQLNNSNATPAAVSVFARYTLPAAEVKSAGKGMQLVRRMEIFRDGQWLPVGKDSRLRPGNRLRTVLTLKVEEDYDYIALKSPRAAGLTPTQPLSGVRWQDALSYYRSVGDASTSFFFDRLEKGTYTLTEEFFLTHLGSFSLLPATLVSIYAPEFRATTGAERVESLE